MLPLKLTQNKDLKLLFSFFILFISYGLPRIIKYELKTAHKNTLLELSEIEA